MEVGPVTGEPDYAAALAEIERLFDAAPGTPEADHLEGLAALVEAYEDMHHSIPLPDAIESILYYLESCGLSRRDLEPYLGSRARVSEVLNRRRPLSLEMVRRLNAPFGIPAEGLIQPYECRQAA